MGDPPLASIRSAALTGLAWFAGQALILKVASVLGRIALAYWLTPADFGLVAMCDALLGAVVLVQRAGLREQIVTASDRRTVAGTAFWVSVGTGTLGAVLILALRPSAAVFFADPRLAPLLLFLGLTSPLLTLPTAPQGVLEGDLHFAPVAKVNVITGLTATGLAVLLAMLGFGPLSVLIPGPVVAVLSLIGLLRALCPWRPKAFDLRVALRLLARGLPVVGTGLAMWLVAFGDNVLIGRLMGTETLGHYAFAFALSSQAWVLVVSNMPSVLPAAFRAAGERGERDQAEAFAWTVRTMIALAVPLCAVQALLARPVISLILDPRWRPAIPVVEILSLGMLFRILGAPGQHLLEARRRFVTLALATGSSAALFLALVACGAATGVVWRVALAVACGYAIDAALKLSLSECLQWPLARRVAVSVGMGVLAFGPAVGLRMLGAGFPFDVAFTLAGLPAFALLLRWSDPPTWSETVGLLRRQSAGS